MSVPPNGGATGDRDPAGTPAPAAPPSPAREERDGHQERDGRPEHDGRRERHEGRAPGQHPESEEHLRPGEHPESGRHPRPGEHPEETTLPEDPARVVRVSRMIRALLDELHAVAPDAAGRARIRAACERALPELRAALTPEMAAELDRLVAPFTGDEAPGRTELRIVHAQLAGWLAGVWDGVRIGDAMRGAAGPPGEEPGGMEDAYGPG